MALTINTNIGSLVVKKDLQDITKALGKALKQAKIADSFKDIETIVATPQINEKLNTQLNAISVAQDNVAIGSSMLSTADVSLDLISDRLRKIQTVAQDTESENITNDTAKAEIEKLWNEIDKIASQAEFNGQKLFDNSNKEVQFQVGTDISNASKIIVSAEVLSDSTVATLAGIQKSDFFEFIESKNYSALYEKLGNAEVQINKRKHNINELQSKFDFTADALDVKYANITSSMSTIKDADIVISSADSIKSQILEQAAQSLSSTANQIPSVAINLM